MKQTKQKTQQFIHSNNNGIGNEAGGFNVGDQKQINKINFTKI